MKAMICKELSIMLSNLSLLLKGYNTMTTLFNIYDAAFDSSNKEFWKNLTDSKITYVKRYVKDYAADNFNMYLSDDQSSFIAAYFMYCHRREDMFKEHLTAI